MVESRTGSKGGMLPMLTRRPVFTSFLTIILINIAVFAAASSTDGKTVGYFRSIRWETRPVDQPSSLSMKMITSGLLLRGWAN